MERVEIIDRGKVAILRLNNGVTNTIDMELLEELSEALPMIRNGFRGMVLTGGEKFFSMGFDLSVLVDFSRTEMSDFIHKFDDIVMDLFTLPLPTCCAISGHATAGGAILALTGDYRFAAMGKKLIGLSGIKLGAPVPYLADLMLRQIVGDRSATEMLYGGEYMVMSEAKNIGLVDEVMVQKELEERAVEKISRIAEFSQAAFSAIKANRVEEVKARYETNHKSKNELFLDCWLSDTARELIKKASEKFLTR